MHFWDNLGKTWTLTEHKKMKEEETAEERQTINPTNPGVQRRQSHLHTLQPLSQCSDLTPELTLPLTQAVLILPTTERRDNT